MEVSLTIEDTTGTADLKLAGSILIQHASQLKEVLKDALNRATATRLDLSEAEAFDLSSVQLLYAFHLASQAVGKPLTLQGECPELFRKTVENVGLAWPNWLCFGNSGDNAP